MQHYLAYPFIEKGIKKPISEKEHGELLQAKKTVLSAFYFETNMNLLLGNAAEYKDVVQSISQTLGFHSENHDAHKAAMLMSRKIMNFLSSTYAYTEHGKNLIDNISGDNKEFDTKKKAEWSDEIQFMESIRNYCQHHSFPVYSVTISTAKGNILKPNISVDEIVGSLLEYEQNKKHKNNKELLLRFQKNNKVMLNFNELIDEYLDFLWKLHVYFTNKNLQIVQGDQNLIDTAISEMESLVGKKLSCCYLLRENGINNCMKEFINRNPIEGYANYLHENKMLYAQLVAL